MTLAILSDDGTYHAAPGSMACQGALQVTSQATSPFPAIAGIWNWSTNDNRYIVFMLLTLDALIR